MIFRMIGSSASRASRSHQTFVTGTRVLDIRCETSSSDNTRHTTNAHRPAAAHRAAQGDPPRVLSAATTSTTTPAKPTTR
jgi:hypothetical protein